MDEFPAKYATSCLVLRLSDVTKTRYFSSFSLARLIYLRKQFITGRYVTALHEATNVCHKIPSSLVRQLNKNHIQIPIEKLQMALVFQHSRRAKAKIWNQIYTQSSQHQGGRRVGAELLVASSRGKLMFYINGNFTVFLRNILLFRTRKGREGGAIIKKKTRFLKTNTNTPGRISSNLP